MLNRGLYFLSDLAILQTIRTQRYRGKMNVLRSEIIKVSSVLPLKISPPVWTHVVTNPPIQEEVDDNDTAQFKGNTKQNLVQAVLRILREKPT